MALPRSVHLATGSGYSIYATTATVLNTGTTRMARTTQRTKTMAWSNDLLISLAVDAGLSTAVAETDEGSSSMVAGSAGFLSLKYFAEIHFRDECS